jgi:hypothetical protein
MRRADLNAVDERDRPVSGVVRMLLDAPASRHFNKYEINLQPMPS